MHESLKRNCFVFNTKNNGGESLSLISTIFGTGDKDLVFLNQELTLQSYGNSASFNLTTAVFTPDNLRQLANELDKAIVEAKAMIK